MFKKQKSIPVGMLFIFLTYLYPNGYAESPFFFTKSGFRFAYPFVIRTSFIFEPSSSGPVADPND